MSRTQSVVFWILAVSTVAAVLWSLLNMAGNPSFEQGALTRSAPGRPSSPPHSTIIVLDDSLGDQGTLATSPRSPVGVNSLSSAQGNREIQVFSSRGLPIHHLELRGPNAGWREVPSNAGRVRVPLESGEPTMVRAAGHLERAVPPTAESVGLEPDTLLEIEAPDLQELSVVGTIGEAWGEEGIEILRECSTSAYIGKDRWAIAVSSREFHQRIPSETLELELTHMRGVRFIANLSIRSDLRANWSLPLTFFQEAQSHLYLRLAGAFPRDSKGLRILVDRLGAQELHDRVEHDWGMTAWTHIPFHRALELEGSEAEIPGCVLGAEYQVRCTDEQGNNLGLRRFVHTGLVQTLGLEMSVQFRVQLVESSGRAIRGTPTATVRGRPESPTGASKQEPIRWEGFRRRIALDVDGNGDVLVPPRILLGTGEAAAVPRHTVWIFSSPFYEQTEMDVDSAGAAAVDMGAITLTAIPPDIILYGNPRLDPDKLEASGLLAAGEAPKSSLIVEAARLNADGERELSLLRSADDVSVLQRQGDNLSLEDFFAPPPPALLVHSKLKRTSAPVPFRYVESNRYIREPTNALELRYLVGEHVPPGSWIVIGWKWEGLSSTVSTAQVSIDRRPQAQMFSIPEKGVELWWRIFKVKPRGAGEQILSRGIVAMPRDEAVVELD